MPVDNGGARLLAGRDLELALLDTALSDAAAEHPRVVLVEAEAGMGKSALLDVFLSRAAANRTDAAEPADPGHLAHPARHLRVMRLVCDVYERDVPFGLVEIAIGQPVSANDDALGVGRRLLQWLAEGQRDDATVVLVVDDVQWMDVASTDALRFALRRLRADRVLAVLARRPPQEHDPWAGLLSLDGASVVHPGRLTPEQVVRLAALQRGWQVPVATAGMLVRRTGGLPLLIRALLETGDREQLDDPASLPSSVTDSVHRLMLGLHPSVRRLVQALAVLDEPTGLVALGDVVGDADPATVLAAASRTIALTWDADRQTVSFSHELFRRAVYDDTPPAARQEMHRRASRWTTGDRQLGHRVSAAAGVDAALAADLIAAAEAAQVQHRPAVAAGHLLQARTLTADLARRDDLLLRAALMRLDILDIKGAASLRPGLDQLPPTPFRSLVLGVLARELGEAADASRLLVEARDAATTAGDAPQALRAAAELASLSVLRSDGHSALAVLDQARHDFPAHVEGQRLAMMRGIALWQEGHGAEGIEALTAPDPTVDLLSSSGMVRYYEGDLAGARRDLDEAIAMSRSGSAFEMIDRAYVQRCLVHFHTGEWDLAAVDAHSARTFAEDAERPWTAASAYAVSALVPALRGQSDLARQYLASARAAYERIPSVQAAGLVFRASAMEAAVGERWEQVVAMLSQVRSGPTFERLVVIGSYGWLMVLLVRAQLHLGLRDQAEEACREYAALLVRHPGHGPDRMGLLRAELALARGDDTTARQAYAVDLADPVLPGYPHQYGEALHGAGRLERAVGNRRRAIELLGEARTIFAELRATPALSLVEADLAAAGVSARTGDALDLTPREQDVASLVARGHTNSQVASELFLTAKTIEYHLGNIYAKLGITGRRELRDRMVTS